MPMLKLRLLSSSDTVLFFFCPLPCLGVFLEGLLIDSTWQKSRSTSSKFSSGSWFSQFISLHI
ncbi:hypothetical protein X975_24581, partial [Stegodyphus mimosarum]